MVKNAAIKPHLLFLCSTVPLLRLLPAGRTEPQALKLSSRLRRSNFQYRRSDNQWY